MNLPDIETMSAAVHEAWIASKLAQGITTRKSETGEEFMVPYNELSEVAKTLDRNTVTTVYEAIKKALIFEADQRKYNVPFYDYQSPPKKDEI